MENNLYLSFINNVLKEKEYLILLCLKDVSNLNDELDNLYEMGIISLYYAYKLYHTKDFKCTNFDYLAYRFIMTVMLDYIKCDVK